ncbi:MAG: UDP-N-acetylglucosamine 2-epimerase (non-hydrolyzing), partial [Bacteroidetes bacterium]
AGLRTWNKSNPFPEEINRQLTSRLTDFHFAPTEWARKNLLSEGIPPGTIFVTGNTVIDSLLLTAKENYQFTNQKLQELDFNNKKVMLLTSHRRENFGDPMREVFLACREIVKKNPDVELVYPVHPNPNVQKAAHEIFGNVPRVHLVEPLDYRQFVHLMKRCYLILTDSGGVQEEAPSLGKPVLVLRSTTERPEAIEAGTAMLVGTSGETIVKQTQSLLDDKAVYARMASNVNPYGDGKAGERIVNIVLNALSTER